MIRRLLVVCLVVSALVAPGIAAASDPSQQAVIAQLTRQANAWDKAIVRKDRAAIAANMADDFRQIDGRGDIEDKASFLDGVVAANLSIDPYTVEDFEVRVYGDVALLSGRTRMTGFYDGKPFKSHYRYIDIYVRKAGVWRVASVQITPLSKQP
jgi:ketosteroid isomerase-like protein